MLNEATPAANDWLDFVLSPDGQRQFVLTGFRPVNPEAPGEADLAEYGLTPRTSKAPPTRPTRTPKCRICSP